MKRGKFSQVKTRFFAKRPIRSGVKLMRSVLSPCSSALISACRSPSSVHGLSRFPVPPAGPTPLTGRAGRRWGAGSPFRRLTLRAAAVPTGQDHRRVAMPPLSGEIKLNKQEQELFQTLLDACKHGGLPTTLRAAGGWVRDKLLGRESDDIDIALDDMLGKDFAEAVNAYLSSKGEATHKVAVILSNPEQSKHLETARMKVGQPGLWIDLVNLRSETYAEDSRIPTMEFGSPEQDALRRDLTINSLFYNVNVGAVEDFTGKGLEDLRAGVVRTPLPPTETFLDDPLRVLRSVRFAARFGFDIDPDLVAAAASDEVRTALSEKVSKERVGTELEGMLKGPAPIAAFHQLHRLRLLPVAIAPPADAADALGGGDWAAACVAAADAAEATMAAWEGVTLGPEERRALLLAALLLPLRDVAVKAKKGKTQPLSSYMIRESLKLRNKDVDNVALLHAEAPVMLEIARGVEDAAASGAGLTDVQRAGLGLAIQRQKELWRVGLALGLVLETAAGAAWAGEGGGAGGRGGGAEGGGGGGGGAEARAARCAALAATAAGLRVDEAWLVKPLLDGKAIMAGMGMAKGGPELGKYSAAARAWQLAHPDGTAEEGLAWLLANREQALTGGL